MHIMYIYIYMCVCVCVKLQVSNKFVFKDTTVPVYEDKLDPV